MRPLEELTDREFVGDWLNENGLTGEGVEVGVQAGENAEHILEHWKGTLHLVDSWVKWPDALYQDCTNQIDFDKALIETKERMAKFGERAVIHKMSSNAAYHMFTSQKRTFDFIYIDANHSHDFVTDDIEQWWRLCNHGGLFGGHDFLTRYDESWICEVESAVNNFARSHGLAVHLTPEENGHPSWWVRKL